MTPKEELKQFLDGLTPEQWELIAANLYRVKREIREANKSKEESK